MNRLQFLSYFNLFFSTGLNSVVLAYVVPVFWRTKQRAFLLIAIACAISIVDVVFSHVFRISSRTDPAYVTYQTVRWCIHFTDSIFWCLGVVLLVRPHSHGNAPARPEKSASCQGAGQMDPDL
jgi:urea transporter